MFGIGIGGVMNLHQLVRGGIDAIYSSDFSTQRNYIDFIANKVRRMEASVIYDAEAFFVPNERYLLSYFDPSVLNSGYGFYDHEGHCIWQECLVFPIKDLSDTIVGLAGFNPRKYVEAHETHDWSLNYYSYSNKSIFHKGYYLYMLSGIYERAISDGYLLLVDGLFDCLSLSAEDYNAAALLGSSPTEQIIAQLRFIKKVIILSDNDEAGIELERKLQRQLNNVVYLHQGKTKDVDELLKTDHATKYKMQLDNAINESIMLNHCTHF